jgi:hypothetical protein
MPNVITQYRSISLINYIIKIITKALIERLAPLMDNLIAHTQIVYTIDNVVFAH